MYKDDFDNLIVDLSNNIKERFLANLSNDETNIINELRTLTVKLGRFPSYAELGQIACGIDKSKKGMSYFREKMSQA